MKDPRTKKIEELKAQNKALGKKIDDLHLALEVNQCSYASVDEELKHVKRLLKKEHDLNQSLLRRLLDE